MKRIRIMAFFVTLAYALALMPGLAFAAETHQLAFASDRHDITTAIGDSMAGMPMDVEYVGLIGDMPDGGTIETYAPEFDSSVVYNEVMDVGFNRVSSAEDVDILWALHDGGVNDDAGIVFANGGRGSGVMHVGSDDDGSVAYYVYGVAYYELVDAQEAAAAAQQFETWVDGIDQSVPIIVCCHVPLHFARKDNPGAPAWNRALNYAATGNETPDSGCAISRNVVFLYGHNHTYESEKNSETNELVRTGEFFVPCGSEMQLGATGDVWSSMYYTYVTAGYLKHNTTALLLTVEDGSLVLTKYRDGGVAPDGWYDVGSKRSGQFASAFKTGAVNEVPRVQRVVADLPDGCSITCTDALGGMRTLNGSESCFLQRGTITVTVNPSSDKYTPDSLVVTKSDGEVEVEKVDVQTFTFTLPADDGDVTVSVTEKERIDLSGATVSGVKASYTYTAAAIKPAPTVTLESATLKAGHDYRVLYASNIKAGTATMTIEGVGDYRGKVSKRFTIAKASNTLVAKGKTTTVKHSKLKSKAQVILRSKAITVSKAQGTVAYAKVSGSKGLSVSSAGKITVKKGLKKKSYKIRVKVTAKGNANYKALAKIVTVTVKVA